MAPARAAKLLKKLARLGNLCDMDFSLQSDPAAHWLIKKGFVRRVNGWLYITDTGREYHKQSQRKQIDTGNRPRYR